MFWGLALEPEKKYSKTIDTSFRLTSAVLDTSVKSDEIVRVYIIHNNAKYIIANLGTKANILQSTLDLQFLAGDKIAFYTNGAPVPVHLTGYFVIDEEDDLLDPDLDMGEEMSEEEEAEEEEEDSDEDEAPALVNAGKRKINGLDTSTSKKKKIDSSQTKTEQKSPLLKNFQSKLLAAKEETDSEDSIYEEDEDDEEAEEEEEDEEEEEEEEEEMEVEPVVKKESPKKPQVNGEKPVNAVQTPKSEKKKKKKQKTPNSETKNEVKSETPKSEVQKVHTPKSEKKKKKEQLANGISTPQNKSSTETQKSPLDKSQNKPKSPKEVRAGGLVIEDLVVGSGAPVKSGSRVSMYYEGRLKSNNKMFDKTLSGPPFKFRLGKGEVIKGWDIGIQGMKVGGKRKLVIPAQLAYGKSGAPPTIPPHSTLVFDVEVKGVN